MQVHFPSKLAFASLVLGLIQAPTAASGAGGGLRTAPVKAAPSHPPAYEAIESTPNDALAAAVVQAYVSNPSIAAARYDLRATTDKLGGALARARTTVDLPAGGKYDLTLPGRTTQASRALINRLNDPNIERNALTSMRETNVRVLEKMVDEVAARREAGELTRTDIAQAQTQLQAAQVQFDGARAELESSRATFAAIVGREPGVVARLPALPGLPQTIDEAFISAEAANPALRQTSAT